jgi:DNA gyrase subunit B
MASTGDVYSADQIQVLSAIEAIRRRPGMYIGDVRDGSGLHHLLWELVANSVDERLAGHASRIRVSVEGPLAEVEDDGRGIPIAVAPRQGVRVVELVLTQIHCGPTFDGHLPHVHVSPRGYGIGLVVVNALSEELEVEIHREGYVWRQRYARGEPRGPLERGQRTERTGTRIRFRADRSIFGDRAAFDRAAVRERLVELARFNPGSTFELMCERICEPRGVGAFIDEWLDQDDAECIGDVLVTRAERSGIFSEGPSMRASTSRTCGSPTRS